MNRNRFIWLFAIVALSVKLFRISFRENIIRQLGCVLLQLNPFLFTYICWYKSVFFFFFLFLFLVNPPHICRCNIEEGSIPFQRKKKLITYIIFPPSPEKRPRKGNTDLEIKICAHINQLVGQQILDCIPHILIRITTFEELYKIQQFLIF